MNVLKKTLLHYHKRKHRAFIWVKDKFVLPLEEIERHVPRTGKVCELGSGLGMVGIYLALSGPQRNISGFDISWERVEVANFASRHLDNLNFFKQDLTRSKIKENYQTFLLVDFLHHIPFKAQEQVISHIAGSQKKGNRIIIKEIKKKRGMKYSLNFLCDKFMTKMEDFTDESWL